MENGAQRLINTLANLGVDACFANPGTSEMQLVGALDAQPAIRAILCLFEGVATGAADGYGRMADKPAITLLHLGPGLANGAANLHNARRAQSPIINIVGDHATYHLELDAPLTSDIAGLAKTVSKTTLTSSDSEDIALTASAAFASSLDYPGAVATLILPADHAWTAVDDAPLPATLNAPVPDRVDPATLDQVCAALSGPGQKALFLGGRALREDTLHLAGRIAAKTGARLITETFFTRLQRGAGRVPVERLPYFGEQAAEYLAKIDTLILVGSQYPVSFFAYPDKPSKLPAPDATVLTLANSRQDIADALTQLAALLGAPPEPAQLQPRAQHELVDGPINQVELGKIIANRLPAGAIVSDEGATNSLGAFLMTGCAEPHDWLTLTGGSIGQGLPVAIGAAVACPEQKVVALQADGSAMYTLQALWTMAREQLDITILLLNNRSYGILNIELARVGIEHPGPVAKSLLDLSNPDLNFTQLAEGMGVPAEKVTTVAGLDEAVARAMAHRGPKLIEVML
jgi:acetolactate synthase-1/2/3 large subunit